MNPAVHRSSWRRGRIAVAVLLTAAGVLLLGVPAGLGAEGTAFCGAYLPNGVGLAPLPVAVSNPSTAETAQVRLETAGGILDAADVPPGETVVFELPPNYWLPRTGIEPFGYRVISDRMVTVTQFNDGTTQEDASRLLPESALGTEHLILTYQGLGGLTYLAVVATGKTEVTIVPSADTQGGGSVPPLLPGEELTVTLAPSEVLTVAADEASQGDLTGTAVYSTAPVAVFAGNVGTTIPAGVSAGDPLEEQMLPLRYWSKDYIASRSAVRRDWPPEDDPVGAPDIWRILASEDRTQVTTDPVQPGTPVLLDRGEHVEIESPEPFEISATAPVGVAQYLVGNTYGANGYGDPAMIVFVPTALFTPSHIVHLIEETFRRSYLTVVAPAGETVLIDSAPIPAADFQPIGASGFAAAEVVLTEGTGLQPGEGTKRVEAGVPIAVYAYQYDVAGGEAHAGGMRFEDLNVTVVCDAGGPYTAPCEGPETSIGLDGTASSDPGGNPLTYRWTSLDPGISLDDPALAAPTATMSGTGTFRVRLTVDDGASRRSCEAEVTVEPGAPTGEIPARGPAPLRVRRQGGALAFLFAGAPGDPWAASLYEGTFGAWYSHVPVTCAAAPTEVAPGVFRLDAPLPPGSRYYLLTATGCGGEGPSGFASSGAERDPARNACGF